MASITLHGANSTYTFDPENENSCIGEGGMGRVFIGEQLETKKKVAIKVLFKELTNSASNIERFKIESTVKIKHKNLIEMIDFIEEGGRFHIISEFLEGEVLSDEIEKLRKQGKTFSLSLAKKIILAVADGLEELHNNNIIHRDIKPSNIMILTDGNIKLFDYGVIKKNDEVIKKLTRDGSFIGSYQYASPEQIRNVDRQAINESTDVYSLGITLYELITGNVPFDGSSEYEIMDKQTKETIPLNAKLNTGYYNLIVNATAKDQKHRYKNVVEFKDDLLKLPNGNVSLIQSKWWQKKGLKIASVLILVILTGLVVSSYFENKQNEENYVSNVLKADNFYELAKYDSAKVYYEKANQNIKTDSIEHKVKALNALIPALRDFYGAKYKVAFEGLQKAAELGSGDAYYYLGELTYNGLGTIKDYEKGWEYVNKSVEHGFKMGYARMANVYENGMGVKKDQKKADKYYLEAIESVKKLAEAGDPEALGILGAMYLTGSGVTQNPKIAFDYYLKSANTGYAFNMAVLGLIYEGGLGVKKNIGEAIKWFKKSSDMGDPNAQFELGVLYLEGEGLNNHIYKGLELINRAAEQNHSDALARLGYYYSTGEFVTQDFNKSFYYTEKAFNYDNDNLLATENLALFYHYGLGTDINYILAKTYYLRSVESDNTRIENYYRVALLFQNGGYGLQQSDDEFIRYCELAESGGYTEAREVLGVYYNEKGDSAFKRGDYPLARSYFEKSAARDNEESRRYLSIMNLFGF